MAQVRPNREMSLCRARLQDSEEESEGRIILPWPSLFLLCLAIKLYAPWARENVCTFCRLIHGADP